MARTGRKPSKLGTGFDVLALFQVPRAARLSLSDICRLLGIAKSTASEICQALSEEGYLARIDSGGDVRYAMGERFQRAFADAILRERESLLSLAAEERRKVLLVAELFGAAAEVLGETAGTACRAPTDGDNRADTRSAPTKACPICGLAMDDECDVCGRRGCLAEWWRRQRSTSTETPDLPPVMEVRDGPHRIASTAEMPAAPECGAIG